MECFVAGVDRGQWTLFPDSRDAKSALVRASERCAIIMALILTDVTISF